MAFSKEDIQKKVVSLVSGKLHVEPSAVERAHSFSELGADSLDMVEIVMQLEEDFDIEINDSDAEKMTSLNQVVDYLYKLQK